MTKASRKVPVDTLINGDGNFHVKVWDKLSKSQLMEECPLHAIDHRCRREIVLHI